MEKLNINQIVGDTFEDLTISEMVQIQGSGDITPETTPVCAATVASSVECAGAASAVSGIVLSIFKC
ncbi:lichenicidin A2 family type 2 lantibiotic [Lactococcus lactis subsp. lactis]|uniref:lichenicidin A2 family type 2 lantibiotic n=1 Tax=Lactococcus lactis TaxID=1358 RepID=UPI002649C7AB|nr:lichenicidin A2 family type 2 lantibiotic [Lactococcus lactis]WKB47479.1 lichenicidin A2 family type 2 lantibiotic [Lactococcus lactis subsp. lactis]